MYYRFEEKFANFNEFYNEIKYNGSLALATLERATIMNVRTNYE